MSISPGSKWFVILLLSIGITVAALFVWVRWQSTSIDGFYGVTDSLIDASGPEIAAVYFVRVDAYDTSKIVRVADELSQQVALDTRFAKGRDRSLLLYFFESSDTSALSDVMIDELAYTNPEVRDPAATLLAVKHGYVMQARYKANATTPVEDASLRQVVYYMPRPGVRAADIR